MASLQNTPARRVLSELDANTTISRDASPSKPNAYKPTSSPLKRAYVSFSDHPRSAGNITAGAKRFSEESRSRIGENTPNKRPRPAVHREPTVNESFASTAPGSPVELSSPSSSVGSIEAANESQNTVYTEPDSPGPSPSHRMPQSDLRERARAMKLRLRLASYKVQTNQMDIPISRLQIRFSPSSTARPHSHIYRRRVSSPEPELPALVPSRRTPLPTVSVQRPSDPITSSPPTRSPHKDLHDPLIPRKRVGNTVDSQGRVGSPLWKVRNERDLDTAADSLLNLGRAGVAITRSF